MDIRRAAAFLALALLPSWGAGQALEARAKAQQWLGEWKLISAQRVAERKQVLAGAEAARDQAEAAVRLAQRENDAAALTIAKDALANAFKALVNARKEVELKIQTEQAITHALSRVWKPGDAMMLPLAVKGAVTLTHEGRTRTPLWTSTVLQNGDTVSVPAGGSMTLLLADGHKVQVNESSKFVVEIKKAPGAIEEMRLRLEEGALHIRSRADELHRFWKLINMRYVSPMQVAAVRDTEFEISVDKQGADHFIPLSGKIDLWAREDRAGASPPPWKLDASQAAYRSPENGAAARVSAVDGPSRVVGPDGNERPAGVGDSIAAGEEIKTSDGGLVLLDLVEGQRAVLASASRLGMASNRKNSSNLYMLKEGRARFWGTGAAIASRVLTPSTVTEPRATQYEIALDEGGTADFTVGGGTLTVTAVASRIDRSKINMWWEK